MSRGILYQACILIQNGSGYGREGCLLHGAMLYEGGGERKLGVASYQWGLKQAKLAKPASIVHSKSVAAGKSIERLC